MRSLLIRLNNKIPLSIKNLVKASAYNGVATIVRMVLGLVSNKINSIYLGPSGYAILGQYINYNTILTTFGTGGINSGLIKYTAEYHNQLDKREKIINTSIFIVLICSAVVGLLNIIFCKFLSIYLLKSSQYWSIFVITGFMITLNSIGTVIAGLLNALKQITKLITTQIIVNFIGVLVTIPLVILYNVYGALLSLLVIAPVTVYVNYKFLMKSGFDFKKVRPLFHRESFFKLGKFSVMAFTTALMLPVSQIIIRNFIITNISQESAGYWQGVLKLSSIYMSVIISSLTLYYLPRLSEIKDPKELRSEIFSGYAVLLPLMIAISLSIFIFRDHIINILFTESFKPMRELFPFHLLGDLFKIASWLLAFLMVAKAKGKMYIITEVIFASSYLVFALLFIKKFGVIGITYAYSLNYFIYFLLFIIIFRNLIFKPKSPSIQDSLR
ncbi:MAG: O-antigen translocase [Fibrobacter sp.]|nr:O-antigen translocase [Fibrobacter sp.]